MTGHVVSAWTWFTASDAHVGSVVIVTAFVLFIVGFLAFHRDELRKDDRVRAELAPLYRDKAGHEAWVRAFSETDDER